MASKTEKSISDGHSVKTLADSFMSGWMAIEADSVSNSEATEVALVNRMVQLISAYLISKLLKDLEASDTDGSSPAEESRVRWQKVLQGWGTSVETCDLSSTSLKLLKMVVLLEKLRICQRKMQNFRTYSKLSKLLFCVSKYPELKNTRQQGELVELFAEAKALEAMSLVHVKDRQQCSEQWDARELTFFQNTRRTVLHIISEKLKMPRVFESRLKELATSSYTPSVANSRDGSVERETAPPPPLPQASAQSQAMGEEEEGNMEISEDADTILLDLIPAVDLDVRDELSSIQDEAELQASTMVSDELGTDLAHQQSLTAEKDLPQHSASSTVHHLGKEEEDSEEAHNEMLPLSRPQCEGEQEAAGVEVVANTLYPNVGSSNEYVGMEGETEDQELVLEDEKSPSSVESANLSPTSILQLPYVRETVEWSSDESLDLMAETEGEPKRLHTYPPLKLRCVSGSSSSGVGSGINNTSSSGAGRIRWKKEEVEYLKKGVETYGVGNWRVILQSYPFHSRRSNVDLKDKWRNLQKKH